MRAPPGEFAGYIRGNVARIPNYGERDRCGETISSAFVESTVDQVISKRMVNKQQMRWSLAGAQLFLQVRTQVLNNDLTTSRESGRPVRGLRALVPGLHPPGRPG